jgi:putative ABC transport system permease protein
MRACAHGMNPLGAIIRLAWRDMRAQPTGFRLYASALGLGIGAMVAVASFRDSMANALDVQTRALLGSDLTVRARRAFSEEARSFFDRVPGEHADEIQFRTMAWFPASEKARFVQVRAIEAAYPFYGRLDADPPEAAARVHEGAFALVEENALIQAGADIGARIRLGAREFIVAGKLLRAPGESPSEAFIAPRVYIPLRFVEETGLLQPGSIVSHRRYFRLPEGASAEEWQERIRQRLAGERLEIETAETRKRSLLGAVDPLARYLGLVGFVGLLLGCVGVAGAAHLYVTRRLPVVAMLRCIGAPRGFCEWVFLAQALALAAAGAGIGAGIAAGALPAVSAWMSGFLAAEVEATLNPRAVALGVAAGLLFGAGFAALPLVAVRKISPAQAMSRFSNERGASWRDPARLAVGAVLLASVTGFAAAQSGDLTHGAALAGGLIAVFAALSLISHGLRAAARRIAARLPWLPARHGVAGLYRPDNQTGVMLSALGLGACLLATLHVAERSLRGALTVYREPDQPTIVLIDVQSDQRAAVSEAMAREGFPPINETPIVALRLDALAGRGVDEILRDPARPVPEWALRREYRGTYRAAMFPTEKLLAGAWLPRWGSSAGSQHGAVPISLERSIAQTLGLGLDDEIVWDVQGAPLRTRVASVREVDWRSMKPNFYVVFPEGPLDAAPQSWALFARASDAGGAAALQRIVAERFPNVSAIDLALVLSSVNTVLERLADAARGIAWFALAAGALVVAGAVRANREQREREWALMRTLGASARHLVAVSVVEHALLGLLGGLAGVGLGAVAGGLIAREILKIDPDFSALALGSGVLALALMTALLGFVAARPRSATPLERLRRLEV